MRLAAYVYALAAIAVISATVTWALNTEREVAATHLSVRDGHRYSTAAPSDHEALAACVTCHRVEKSGPERSAPALVGILGGQVARATWFGYSPALRRKGGNWTRDTLDAYLANPVAAAPGTFKTLSPIADPKRRKAIIDALARL